MENTVAQKLDNLLKLQTIDCKLDDIKKVRGDLPEEVRDLEDEIAQYETRVSKFEGEAGAVSQAISDKKTAIKNAEGLIVKYDEQLMDVKNNREFDAISKEIETQKLDIEIFHKKIKEDENQLELVKVKINDAKEHLEERMKDLENKNKELSTIMEDTSQDEAKLNKDREKQVKKIEERLYLSYQKIRGNARNGLAVVAVKRAACGGCFNMVPPQRQADIRDRKKLIVCEHCGRILADVEMVIEEEKPKKKTRAKAKPKAKK